MGEIADALRRGREGRQEAGATLPRESPDVRPPPPAPPPERAYTDPSEPGSRRHTANADLLKPAAPTRVEREPTRADSREHDALPDPILEGSIADEVTRGQRVQSITRAGANASRAARISVLDPADHASYRYRHLANRVARVLHDRDAKSIVVTSSQTGDGKTTTACNLAIQMSRLDRSRSVVLVDLDLHRPSIARSLGLRVDAGVDEVLSGRASLVDGIIATDVGGLDVLAGSGPMRNTDDLLSSDRIARLLDVLSRAYSLAILDTPPTLVSSDATSIVNVADACLLVARAGVSATPLIRESLVQIPRDKLIGTCMNMAKPPARMEYGYGGYPAPVDDELESELIDSEVVEGN